MGAGGTSSDILLDMGHGIGVGLGGVRGQQLISLGGVCGAPGGDGAQLVGNGQRGNGGVHLGVSIGVAAGALSGSATGKMSGQRLELWHLRKNQDGD